MKREGLLNRELSGLVASLGHGETVCLSDAGLPVPPGIQRIDLALSPGIPRLLEVLDALLSELLVERYVFASESLDHTPWLATELHQRLAPLEPVIVPHAELKALTVATRAVVRTGEWSPFSNVVLTSGVDFSQR